MDLMNQPPVTGTPGTPLTNSFAPNNPAPMAGGPGDPNHDLFVHGATGQAPVPSNNNSGPVQAPEVYEVRPKIIGSTNPIMRLLGAITGRQTYDYGDPVSVTNQAPIADLLTKLTGTPAATTPSTDATGKPFLSSADVMSQMNIADQVMRMMQTNLMRPQEYYTAQQLKDAQVLHPDQTDNLIKAFGDRIPKDIVHNQQTNNAQVISNNKLSQEQNNTIANAQKEYNDKMEGIQNAQNTATQIYNLYKQLQQKGWTGPVTGRLADVVSSLTKGGFAPEAQAMQNLGLAYSGELNKSLGINRAAQYELENIFRAGNQASQSPELADLQHQAMLTNLGNEAQNIGDSLDRTVNAIKTGRIQKVVPNSVPDTGNGIKTASDFLKKKGLK